MDAVTAAAPLRVRALGGFAVWRGDDPIPAGAWSRRKVLALFTCLLCAPGYRLHREELIDRLWPEAGPEAGANNLRVTLHRLRDALNGSAAGAGYVRAVGDVVALAPFPAHAGAGTPEEEWLDAAAFARAATAALAGRDLAACRAARSRYTGDYLPDALYEEWSATRREELRQQYLALLVHGARLSLEGDDARESENWLAAVLAQDRCHEGAARGLMRLYAREGRRGEALRVYADLERALAAELGQQPGARAQALATTLRAGAAPQQQPRPAQPPTPAGAEINPTLQVAPPSNLPASISSFVGRQREQQEIGALLADHRLVVLTGPGGVGKTRLALAAAERLVDRYPDGVWLAELAPLRGSRDPGAPLVGQAVAQALGVREEADRPLLRTLTEYLASRRLLLILDNCEHLVVACAVLAQTLLRACPGLRILATSRERLEVTGEVGYQVPPLAIPECTADQRGPASPDALRAVAAVALFVERAQERRPGFTLTAENAPAVAQICRRLEGLPLAIELAAARLSVLPVAQIAARLDEACRLLSGGPRVGEARQQSLQAAFDWSHASLAEPEQVLFRRLSIFAGGCTLDAAEAVCAGEGIEPWVALDLLSGLVHKSLVYLEEPSARGARRAMPEEARFRLLEPVRQYSRERLLAAGEEPAVRARHLAWCLALAEQAEPALLGPEQARWLDRLEAEHDNLRVALTRCIQRGAAPEAAVRLAGPLWRFWWLRGHAGEGRRWLEAALACGAAAPADQRARALNGAGALAYYQGDYARARTLYGQSLALRRQLGDMRGVASSLSNLGAVADDLGDYAQAQGLYEESLALRRALGDTWGIAVALNNLGNIAQQGKDFVRARALHEESLALRRALGDTWGTSNGLASLGEVACNLADYDQARALYEESLAMKRDLGDTPGIANALVHLGSIACEQGQLDRAGMLLRDSLGLYGAVGERKGIAETLEALAVVITKAGEPERAVRLLGAAATLRRAINAPVHPNERDAYEQTLAALRSALGEDAYSRAWAAGQALSPEQAAALAESMMQAAPARAWEGGKQGQAQ